MGSLFSRKAASIQILAIEFRSHFAEKSIYDILGVRDLRF
jgi:hypothetical protein